MKRTESPATSLFALTNTLHPVVRRCLLGCPENSQERGYEKQGFALRTSCQFLPITLARISIILTLLFTKVIIIVQQ
jgi:hypothetical protein